MKKISANPILEDFDFGVGSTSGKEPKVQEEPDYSTLPLPDEDFFKGFDDPLDVPKTSVVQTPGKKQNILEELQNLMKGVTSKEISKPEIEEKPLPKESDFTIPIKPSFDWEGFVSEHSKEESDDEISDEELSDELPKFEDDDEEEEVKTSPIPEKIDNNILSKAEDDLESLSTKYDFLVSLTRIIQKTNESILIDRELDKLPDLAQHLGLAMYELDLFIKNSYKQISDKEHKKIALYSAKILYKNYVDMFNNLPNEIKGKASDFVKSLQKIEENIPTKFTSQWRSLQQVFVRNRGIDIALAEGINYSDAEIKAYQEWQKINTIVDSIATNLSSKDKDQLIQMFTEQLLGRSSSFEEAENLIKQFVFKGGNRELPFANLIFDDQDWISQGLVNDLADSETVAEAVKLVPENNKDNISNKILKFADLSQELGNLTKNFIGVEREVPSDIISEAKELYAQIAPIAQEVMLLDPSILKSDDLFEEFYIVSKNMAQIANEIGLDVMSQADTSEEGGLNFINPINQSPNHNTKKRKRNKEIDDRARAAYIKGIKDAGLYPQLLAHKAKLTEELVKRNPKLREKATIRASYASSLGRIINGLVNAAIVKPNPKDKDSVAKSLNDAKVQMAKAKQSVTNFYIFMAKKYNSPKSELLEKDLKQLEKEAREKSFKQILEAYNRLSKESKSGNYVNSQIMELIDQLKHEILSYFDSAKTETQNLFLKKKTATIYNLADIFVKYASIL